MKLWSAGTIRSDRGQAVIINLRGDFHTHQFQCSLQAEYQTFTTSRLGFTAALQRNSTDAYQSGTRGFKEFPCTKIAGTFNEFRALQYLCHDSTISKQMPPCIMSQDMWIEVGRSILLCKGRYAQHHGIRQESLQSGGGAGSREETRAPEDQLRQYVCDDMHDSRTARPAHNNFQQPIRCVSRGCVPQQMPALAHATTAQPQHHACPRIRDVPDTIISPRLSRYPAVGAYPDMHSAANDPIDSARHGNNQPSRMSRHTQDSRLPVLLDNRSAPRPIVHIKAYATRQNHHDP